MVIQPAVDWFREDGYAALPKGVSVGGGHAVRFVYAVIISRICLVETLELADEGCVDDRRSISTRDFVRLTGLSRGAISNAVWDLEQRGLIECDRWNLQDVRQINIFGVPGAERYM